MRVLKRFEWLIYIVIVLVGLILLNFPAFDLTFGIFNSGDGTLLWPSIVGTCFNLLLFYSIAFHLIPISLRKGTRLFATQLMLLFFGVSGIEMISDSIFYRASGAVLDSARRAELIIMVVSTHLLVVIFAFAYRFSRDWFANEQLRRRISEHQLRSELEVLKSQINPHFLFNALNNLFSMALQSGDEKTAEGINKLSEMMRYVFDKTGKDRVALQEEVQYISDYIYLQQLRFNKQVSVRFDHPATMAGFQLAPMLLIPFVENAFKYGVSAQSKTIISITISLAQETFIFEIENQKAARTETIPSSGLGIENVRRRLNLVYPDQHALTVTENPTSFKVRLVISKNDEVYSNR